MTARSTQAPPEFPFWRLQRLRGIDSVCNARYDAARLEPTGPWRVEESKLSLVARIVATSLVRKSPQLRIPAYGPLGRLDPDGYDRLSALHGRFDALGAEQNERVRSLADFLVIASLMDLDHGPTWRTRTRTGALLASEQGSLVVSYGMFVNGLLSNAGAADPMRVDADALLALDRDALDVAFAAVEGAPSVALDEALRRLHAIAKDIPPDESGARRPGASLVDQTLAKPAANGERWLSSDTLFSQCVRVLMPALDDRTKLDGARGLTDADGAYLSLLYALHPLVTTISKCEDPLDGHVSPPDRWTTQLLLDTGVIAPSGARSIDAVRAERPAREALNDLVSIALNAAYVQTLSLMKLDAKRLSKSAFLWGATQGGRALSARARPSV